jgi:hypothetical protein
MCFTSFILHSNIAAMKNYKVGLIVLIALVSLLQSCIKHEVIPAPVPAVDLSCNFLGTIDGTSIELTENVAGYAGKATKNLTILPGPAVSSAAYNFEMSSPTSMNSVKIVLGSVLWNSSVSISPDLTAFNVFHTTSVSPVYSTSGTSGLEVSFRDGSGLIWTSKQNSKNAQNVSFTGITQESDSSGDYSKFTCNFNCYVYHQDPSSLLWDSLNIKNGTLKGWFQR